MTDELTNALILYKSIEYRLVGIDHEERSLDLVLLPLAQDEAVIIIDQYTYVRLAGYIPKPSFTKEES